MSAGTVLLCQPGTTDRFHWDKTQTTRHGFIHFQLQDTHKYFLPLLRRTSGRDVLIPLLRQAVWLAEQDVEWLHIHALEAVRQALFWYIWGFYSHRSVNLPAEQPAVLSRALQVIKEYWKGDRLEAISVSELAELTNVSRGHLARVCKQHLKLSPQAMIRLLRLEHGLLLLTRTDLEVQSISELCGFANPFHFSRCCKSTYNAAPSELRRLARTGASRPLCPTPGIRQIFQQQIAQ